MSLLALRTGSLVVRGTLIHDPRGAILVLAQDGVPDVESSDSSRLSGKLVAITDSGDALSARRFSADLDSEPGPAARLTMVVLVRGPGAPAALSSQAVQVFLRAALAAPVASVLSEHDDLPDDDLIHRYESLCTRRIGEVASGVPACSVPGDVLELALASGSAEPVRAAAPRPPLDYDDAQVEALRRMQELAGRVYGRLEPERAVAWAAEEFGELAQALRRREHTFRLEEEIGQMLSWLFCLANIAEVDLGEAARRALGREVFRQMSAHGRVRPYRSPGFREVS